MKDCIGLSTKTRTVYRKFYEFLVDCIQVTDTVGTLEADGLLAHARKLFTVLERNKRQHGSAFHPYVVDKIPSINRGNLLNKTRRGNVTFCDVVFCLKNGCV